MKKSQIALLIVGVLTITGVPSIIAIEQANQARIEMERARQATLQAQEAAEAERQELEEEQEAIRQREAERERQAEARRAEEQVRREEQQRLEAAQRRQEQERLAAQQREQQQMVTRTAEAWNQFAEVVVNAERYSEDSEADPMVMLKYVVNSLDPISTHQVDPQVATLISNVRDTTNQAYGLMTDYQERQKQLGFNTAEASKFGCEAINAIREQNSIGWCLAMAALSGTVSYANGSAELEELRAEYASRLEQISETLNTYDAEVQRIPAYLQETYGIDAMEI